MKITFHIQKERVGQVVKNSGCLYSPHTFLFFFLNHCEENPEQARKAPFFYTAPCWRSLGRIRGMTAHWLQGGLGVQHNFGWNPDSTTYYMCFF